MKLEKQRVLLVGLSYFGKELLKSISVGWQAVALEIEESRIELCRKEMTGPDDVQYVSGAADSPVTWKKLDPCSLKYIVSTLRDIDTNLEMCRIIREELELKIPVILLIYGDTESKEDLFAPYNVSLINPLKPAVQSVLKKLDKNVIHAVNLGLEKGELIEVAIRAGSHLVDRKLKYLRPSRWHISALYRDHRLLLPDGNCKLKVGDRVVLVGDPRVLENVTSILLKGEPQFPLQYGTDVVFPLNVDFEANMGEAIYWKNSFKAARIQFVPFKKKLSAALKERIKKDVPHFEVGETISLFKEIFGLPLYDNAGVMVMPCSRGWFTGSRLRETFKRSRKPFLVSRLSYPYKEVVVCLNGPDPVQAMETATEISRMASIPFRAVYVTLPKAMRGREDDARLQLRRQVVSDFEGIYKQTVDYKVLQGNPVLETVKFLEPLGKSLLVLAANPERSPSVFKPHVPYLVAKRTHLSTLVIPETETNE